MSKPKSDFARNLDLIQQAVDSFLKPLGFRKKGRTYNRVTSAGLIHVLGFQMGSFPIGDHYEIPGFRESFYGKFAVNLGVLLPCVYEAERQRPPAEFVQEYHCTIRKRLSALAFGDDRWFEIACDTGPLAVTIVDLLDRFGLHFFEQFKSYVGVLSYYRAHGDLPFQSEGRASLEAALVAHHVGDGGLCAALFAKAYATNNRGFQQHVAELAKRLGHAVG